MTVVDTTAPVVTAPADVTAIATSPAGAVVTYANATATDAVGVVSGPACVPASGSTFPLGTTTVTCTASDAAGNTGSATFTVTVVSPAQATQNLITAIGNMGLPAGVATSLRAPLNNLNPNNVNAACGKLNAFINQVNTKAQNGQLTPTQASQLLQAANGIKTALGCP
ncbi:MAG: HYR domain-containing protein [Chloroflexota bacterium]|nr:HYR domain-containing protein [Chloroflexota bacterium]